MQKKKIMRGFAIMSKEKLRAVTSAGGKAAHALGRAHTWTKEEAAQAGRIGGKYVGGKKLRGSKWSKLSETKLS